MRPNLSKDFHVLVRNGITTLIKFQAAQKTFYMELRISYAR